MKPRRLADLYVIGKDVVFDDGEGDSVKVWLQKISPLDHETALRRANLVRARVLAKHENDATDYNLAKFEAAELGPDAQVEYLVMDEVNKRTPAVEAEIASDEPWCKENYLQSLRDSWADGLSRRYQEDPDDEEAAHVFAEMSKFLKAVDEQLEDIKDDVRTELESRDPEWILEQVADKFLQSRADIAWLTEFRKAEIWLATRDSKDHRTRYFENREEVDELAQEVMVRLLTEYRDLVTEPIEGKDSAAPDNSSESSESPEKPETVEPSGLTVASG